MNKNIKLAIAISLPLAVWLMPSSWIPIENLSVIEHRLLAIFTMAMSFWLLEPVPVFSTSVLIILMELLLVSDKQPYLFSGEGEGFGQAVSYREIFSTFASPIIILFLGGFFLAGAATKFRLDTTLARVLLRPFGSSPKRVMLGIMIVTAVFSMFMSNTATTAMMLAILAPILSSFKSDDPARTSFALAVPFAANVGGLGTPIGTPPNAVALKYLTGPDSVSFSEWMMFGVPYTLVMLFVVWGVLLLMFPPRATKMQLKLEGSFQKNRNTILTSCIFAGTILLWLTDFLHGMNSYTVAMFPIAAFTLTGLITAKDMRNMSWDVLWLVSGGIALGLAMDKTGLSRHVVESIPFDTFPPLLIAGSACVLTVVMGSFISHTATANLLLPIMAALGVGIESLADVGGLRMLVIGVAFAASLGMSLPISTPPNALAYSTGTIRTSQMLKSGALIGVLGLILLAGLLFVLKSLSWF